MRFSFCHLNCSYRENIAEMSRNFRDQKEKPLERAIWWIEWSMRHPTADYIRSPVLKHGQIAGNSFDLIAVLTVATILIGLILWKCLMALGRLCVGRREISDNIKWKQQ